MDLNKNKSIKFRGNMQERCKGGIAWNEVMEIAYRDEKTYTADDVKERLYIIVITEDEDFHHLQNDFIQRMTVSGE